MKNLVDFINEDNATAFKIEKIIDKNCGRRGDKEIYLNKPFTVDGQEYTKVGKFDHWRGTYYIMMIDDNDHEGKSLYGLSDEDEKILLGMLDKKEFTVK